MYTTLGDIPDSIFEVTAPKSVALAKSFVVLHLYPVAPATALQFQVIWFKETICVPGAGAETPGIVCVRVVAGEFPQPFVVSL